MINLYYTICDTWLSDEDVHALLSILPHNEQKQNSRYRRWQDRQIHLIGRLLLLHGLVERGLSPNSLEGFRTTSFGKPFINNAIVFNLSHSSKAVVCAVTDRGQIGIDVETIKEIDFSWYKSVMSDEEWLAIESAKDQKKSFFEYWTKKEAVIKGDGRGLRVPLKQIQFKENFAVLSGTKWSIKRIDLGNPFICHLVIDRSDDKIVKKELKTDELRWVFQHVLSPSTL